MVYARAARWLKWKQSWSLKMYKLPLSAQILIPRTCIVILLHLLRLLVKPRCMEKKIIPNIPYLHCTVKTRLITHLWWASIDCCYVSHISFFPLSSLEELYWRFTDTVYDFSVHQVGSRLSFTIGTQQNSLEDCDTKYLKHYYCSLVF